MQPRQSFDTTSLREKIGDVAALSAEQIANISGISMRTLNRYQEQLRELELPGFNCPKNTRSIDTIAAEYIYQFVQIAKALGPTRAADKISLHMQEFYSKHDSTHRVSVR
jgi:hypothetical protein